MSFTVLYASHPPQCSTELGLDALAALDARFGQLRGLRERGTLDLVVQDSADLLGAHLVLRRGRHEWPGHPGRLDEDGAGRCPCAGWSERALDHALGLDLTPCRRADLDAGPLFEELARWTRGIVYALGGPGTAQVTRRLNLASDLDRLELTFLVPGAALLRAHRLEAGGGQVVLRAELAPSIQGA